MLQSKVVNLNTPGILVCFFILFVVVVVVVFCFVLFCFVFFFNLV